MSQSKELVLIQDNETYNLLEIPKSTTKLAVIVKQKMMEDLDLPQLAKDLSNLGMFLRLAFNGVVGHNIDLQTKVRKLFYDLLDLCDECVRTVNQFKRASNTAIENLQSTYQYLADGLDELAVISLKELGAMASKMKKAADNLSKEFQKEAKIVQQLEEEVSRAEAKSDESSKQKAQERRDADADRGIQKTKHDDMLEDEKKAEKEYEEAQRKEIEEVMKQKLGFFKGLLNVVTTHPLTREGVYDKDIKAAKEAAEIYAKDKERSYKDMIKAREQRREALEQMASFAKKMEQLSNESKLESAAAESLHHAASALVNLALIMKNTSRFWEENESMCEELCSENMVKLIQGYSNLDDEKRMKAFNNASFKESGIKFYYKWMAIKEVCETCQGAVKNAQRSVHVYIRENPTKEEACSTVKKLAPQLKAILEKDIDEFENQQAIQNSVVKLAITN